MSVAPDRVQWRGFVLAMLNHGGGGCFYYRVGFEFCHQLASLSIVPTPLADASLSKLERGFCCGFQKALKRHGSLYGMKIITKQLKMARKVSILIPSVALFTVKGNFYSSML
jgi:hypothetical protein